MAGAWSIGDKRIPPRTVDPGMPLSPSNASMPSLTINVTEMLRSGSGAERKAVAIRPPGPRPPGARELEFRRGVSCEPAPKPIIRGRSRSLPSPNERRRHSRSARVRFVDSLGLDLEDVKVFRTGEDPFVPHHVTFRLLMGAELAGGKNLEISLPYLKPVFPHQPGDDPEFLRCLQKRKVCLERVLCFELGIIGITQVVNLDFQKEVSVRYSFTEWKSFTETKASWVSTIATPWAGDDGQLSCDTFRFHLPVPPFLQAGAGLEFAIRYKVCGAEFWDNNDGKNYKLINHSYKLTVPKECEDSMVHFI
ncbi:protein phosphatase 1, regulatory subunit 3Da [Osmerus mordax]|uniref:protein phosphatase 1, regulatory subunit 3Da n=1 Tax=Osmerus mordax TaxID=8014 RepID=UPI0035104FBD